MNISFNITNLKELFLREDLTGLNKNTKADPRTLPWQEASQFCHYSGRTLTDGTGLHHVNYESCYKNLAPVVVSYLIKIHSNIPQSGFYHNNINISACCQKAQFRTTGWLQRQHIQIILKETPKVIYCVASLLKGPSCLQPEIELLFFFPFHKESIKTAVVLCKRNTYALSKLFPYIIGQPKRFTEHSLPLLFPPTGFVKTLLLPSIFNWMF